MSQALNIIVPDALVDVQHVNDGMLPDGYDEDSLCAGGATRFPDKFRVPRSEWDDRIRDLEKNNASAIDFSARYTHQGNSHECVSHASVQCFEIMYNRQLGLNHAVYFSPVALYTRITGGRQWGGSVVMDALREAMNVGMIPEHDGPDWLGGKNGQYQRFKATVHQTSGRSEPQWPTKGWIRERDFPPAWKDTARHFRVLEAFTIPDREAHMSALLRGWAIVNGRNGHSICHCEAVKDSRGRYLSKYRDSYNRDLYDTESLLGGGYCVRLVTQPDDPTRPAGADMKV